MIATGSSQVFQQKRVQPVEIRKPGSDGADVVWTGSGQVLVLLDERTLDRQCLAQCLTSRGIGKDILAYGSIREWKADASEKRGAAVVMLNLGGRKVTDPAVGAEIAALVAEVQPTPVAIMADSSDLVQVVKAFDYGAKAYVPSSTRLEVCVEAVNLVVAGGTFMPADSVLGMQKILTMEERGAARPLASVFTARQEEVVKALRRGKANKIIAHELNLRESTVKVHIRNIMKKLRATNRTEVAYKLNEMFPFTSGAPN